MSANTDRHAAGLATLQSITASSGEAVVNSLKDIAPDFADWIVAFAYGDVQLGRGFLALYCGEVRDDGGSASLAKIAEQGSYCRTQPGIQTRWRTERLARYAFGLRFAYSQTYDLQDDWDRGYGELEASMGIKESPLQLILLYRKGRKAPTFDLEKALVFGVGLQF